jgi:signal transduction histidine kinase
MTQAMSDYITRTFREVVILSLVLAAGAAFAAAMLASYLLSQRIVAPIHRLARASSRIASGHYAERAPHGGNDELGELAESFNQMATSLEETERRRLALIGDVAHELRTPLSTIEGYTEGLLDGVIEGSSETYALILREAGRLRRLVDDLQDLSRAEAKQISFHPRLVAPRQLVEGAIARLRPQMEEKGLHIEVDTPEGLPNVYADEDRTGQVLINLLGNALRYTPAGGRIAVQVRRLAGQVEFAVIDTGVGIAPEHLPHVFERFYQVDQSRSRPTGGTGIGLTIARYLIEAQGGTIKVESPGAGRGSTFSFTLPKAS